ncbi:MAG: response regulator [Pseudomonadota bacterium]
MPQILLVEDETALLEAMEEELRDEGYEVVCAENGSEALEKLANYAPDLILSDIAMPQMDGHALLQEVREKFPKLIETPFVFLTAFNAKADIIKGKKLGADDYLVKPVDFDLLFATIDSRLAQVDRMIELKEQQFLKLYNSFQALENNNPLPEEDDLETEQILSNSIMDDLDEEEEDDKYNLKDNLTDGELHDEAAEKFEDDEDLDQDPELDEILERGHELEPELDEDGLPIPPDMPDLEDVAEYAQRFQMIYGILVHFENIKTLFERTKRNSTVSIGKLISDELDAILPTDVCIDADLPGNVMIYFAKDKRQYNDIDFRYIYNQAQNIIFNSEVSELITTNLSNTFTGSHLRVSQVPFNIEVSPDDNIVSTGITHFLRNELTKQYNNIEHLETILEEIKQNSTLNEAKYRSRYNRTREVKFFYYDEDTQASLRSIYAFLSPSVLSDLEFELDKIFLQKIADGASKLSGVSYCAIDVHFDTLLKPERLVVYRKLYKEYVARLGLKLIFCVRGLPRNINPKAFNDLTSKIKIPNARFMLQLNPWKDFSIPVDKFSVPFITWNFPDIYGFNSKLEHIKRLKLIYKSSQSSVLIRNIPNNCDIMFLKGFGFDAFSFNFDIANARKKKNTTPRF